MYNMFAAILLSAFTFVLLYGGWYVIRGRRHRARDHGERRSPEADPTQDATEPTPVKYDKKSYCYPKMNDVMGYDFIRVVSVDESLRPVPKAGVPERADATAPENAPEQEKEQYEGAVEAVSSGRNEDMEDVFEPQGLSRPNRYPGIRRNDQRWTRPEPVKEKDDKKNDAEPVDVVEDETELDPDYQLSDEEFMALASGNLNITWPNRDHQDDAFYDDYFEDHPEMIEKGTDDGEAERIAAEEREFELFSRINSSEELMTINEEAMEETKNINI